jgi:hypothetical protein
VGAAVVALVTDGWDRAAVLRYLRAAYWQQAPPAGWAGATDGAAAVAAYAWWDTERVGRVADELFARDGRPWALFTPYAALGGNAHIAEDVFLGMHASVGPAKRIGARSKVSANSCALADAPADSIVYGTPGRVGPLINP